MSRDKCDNCGFDKFHKVIYLGMPGKLCMNCDTLYGLASYMPYVSTYHEDTDEYFFDFLVYEGSYWKALWCWITGK